MTAPETLEIHVDEGDTGSRLDVVLARHDALESRAEAQRLIAAGLVTVDGVVVTKRVKLVAGQMIEARRQARAASSLVPEAIPLWIPFEDEHLMVVDKPPGVVTHPSKGHDAGTLVHALLGRGIGGGDTERPGIVHRLDRDTSGLLVVAKTDRAHRRLQEALRLRELDRRYVTLVHGAFPPALSVDRPVGRDRRNRTRQSVITDRPREARTHFRRIGVYERHSLLEARLDTGRTHQIRVHLEAAGFPVVGDPVYGRRSADALGLERQFLHASRLAFTHPETGAALAFESPLPADLEAALERIAPQSGPAR